MRALATLTSASYSSPFLAIAADSVSMSTPLPSARIACGSCCGLKLVASIRAASAEPIACASASWKSTSMRRKPGVSAFARLFASTLCRSEAPEMARSKPSWVLSIRVTGRDRGTARGNASSVPGLRCDPHPWESPQLSALRRRALARAVDEPRLRCLRRVGVHRRAPAHEAAHLGARGLEVLLEQRRRRALQLRGTLQARARLARRYRRQLRHHGAALLPQRGQRVERSGAHERQLALGQLYEAA